MVRLAGLWGSLFVAGLACTVAAPAAAQYGYGAAPRQEVPDTPSQPQEQAQAPVAASRSDVLRAASCVASRDAEAADALLATAPFSADERERAVRLLRAAERCLRLRSPIATTATIFRGAVAESLFESRFAQAPAARAPAALAASYFQPANVASMENAAAISTHYDVGQCAAPRHPDLVRALLATEPASDGEMAALQALYPDFGACVAQGTQLGIDRVLIRAILAEAIYRWSVVQRDGPASAWAAPPTQPSPAG